jgi:hypothetical protein
MQTVDTLSGVAVDHVLLCFVVFRVNLDFHGYRTMTDKHKNKKK